MSSATDAQVLNDLVDAFYLLGEAQFEADVPWISETLFEATHDQW